MQLSIYIDEKLVETIRIPAGHVSVKKLMEDFRKKYADRLKQSDNYRFALENVPSQMNDFQSLLK